MDSAVCQTESATEGEKKKAETVLEWIEEPSEANSSAVGGRDRKAGEEDEERPESKEAQPTAMAIIPVMMEEEQGVQQPAPGEEEKQDSAEHAPKAQQAIPVQELDNPKEGKANEQQEQPMDDQKQREAGHGLAEESDAPPPAKEVRFAPAVDADEMVQLEEYERKLRRNTREALELVDRLCELQSGADQKQERPPIQQRGPVEAEKESAPRRSSTGSAEGVATVREALIAGVHALGAENAPDGNNRSAPLRMDEGPDLDVESVSVSERLLHSPTDCVLLPGHLLLIVDAERGLSLVSLQTRQLLKSVAPAEGQWRNAQCACLGDGTGERTSVIYVLLDCQVGQPSTPNEHVPAEANQPQQEAPQSDAPPHYERFIGRFSVPELALLDRIEAPKWLRERVVVGCRLCYVPQTQCLYLAANTPNQGFFYELHIGDGKWTECAGTKRHKNYSDMHHFAVVGPVTELLLVETNRCYVQMVSVYGSNVVNERMLGLCERPGALCVDERGNVFVHDRASSKVGLYSRAYLEKCGDVALVERANCRLAARAGVLAVMCPLSRELRLCRYAEERFGREREAMLMG